MNFGINCYGDREQACLYSGPNSRYVPKEKDTVTYSPQDIPVKAVSDNVNHPNHYTQGGIECIRAIEASMPPDGFQDYCKGNVLKYIWRWRDKNGIEDLEKAAVYLNWMIESAKKMVGGAE